MALDYLTNSRAYSVTLDSFGIDPLKDKSYDDISSIAEYNLYIVKQQDRGRPDAISSNQYGNPNLWWVIMYYNGLGSIREIKEGTTLRIPAITTLTRILADNASKDYANNVRTFKI